MHSPTSAGSLGCARRQGAEERRGDRPRAARRRPRRRRGGHAVRCARLPPVFLCLLPRDHRRRTLRREARDRESTERLTPSVLSLLSLRGLRPRPAGASPEQGPTPTVPPARSAFGCRRERLTPASPRPAGKALCHSVLPVSGLLRRAVFPKNGHTREIPRDSGAFGRLCSLTGRRPF